MSKGWDNAALKKLKALTGKGLSTSEIGKRLGMSKNAIVGKLNRLGWNAKAGGASADKAVATPAKKVAKATKADAAKKTAVKSTVTTKKAVAKKDTTKVTTKTVAKKTPAKDEGVKEKAKVATKETGKSKTSAKDLAVHQRIVQHSLEMANLKPNQCRWPIGDPDSEHFHFCGETVFVGKPYCYEHFTPPKKK